MFFLLYLVIYRCFISSSQEQITGTAKQILSDTAREYICLGAYIFFFSSLTIGFCAEIQCSPAEMLERCLTKTECRQSGCWLCSNVCCACREESFPESQTSLQHWHHWTRRSWQNHTHGCHH